jgi:magnesium and cobalt transporter
MSNEDSSENNLHNKKFNFFNLFSRKNHSASNSLSSTIVKAVSQKKSSENAIDEEQKKILLNAVNFTDAKVEDIMIPRSDIISIPINAKFDEIKVLIFQTGHTRIPVYEDNLDNIRGFIHIKDLISYFDDKEPQNETKRSNNKNNAFSLTDILHPVLFIPPTMKVVDSILKMRSTNMRIAIVIDEYGGTDGMLTIENLIEEIVGDLDDDEITSLNNNQFEVNARIRIEDLEGRLNISLVKKQQIDDDFDTLGGLIVTLNNNIPETGETIKYHNGIEFYIKEAKARYIKTVIIKLAPKTHKIK